MGFDRVREIFESKNLPTTNSDIGAIRDSKTIFKPASFSTSEIEEIRDELWEEVKGSSGEFTSADELFRQLSKSVLDSFYNNITGINTPADPSYFNTANIPVMLSPTEASALYSSGGLHQAIVDKKINGIFANGYSHVSPGGSFSKKELEGFHQYTRKLQFQTKAKEAGRDALVFGGSGLIPHIKGDTNLTYSMYLPELVDALKGKKDVISHLWSADRWNLVLIPDVIISHKDYLYPDFFQCPLAGLNINTDRISILRVNKLPYWAAIQQIGWGRSDLESYTRAVKAYEMAILAIPIMAQQISLLYHHVPLDGVIAQDGPAAAAQWTTANNQALKAWSMLNPKTINSFGEIKTIDRNYNGFDSLIQILRQDVGAKSGLHESSLFDTQGKGFQGPGDEIAMKQSEYLSNLGSDLAPQFKNVSKVMVLSYFGFTEENLERVEDLELVFESPTVISPEQREKSGASFSTMIQTLSGAQVPLPTAYKLAKLFVDSVEYPDEITSEIKKAQTDNEEAEQKANEAQTEALTNGNQTQRPNTKASSSPGSENASRKIVREGSGKGRS